MQKAAIKDALKHALAGYPDDEADVEWLRQRIHTDVFDLYAIMSRLDRNYVFGCIQSKTSIRDCVTRDREPSSQAMGASFWSVAVVLDGAFLAQPKFQERCSGNGDDYTLNGWHGLYVMSDRYSCGRIFGWIPNIGLLVDHAQQAAEAWMSARHRFNETWLPR